MATLTYKAYEGYHTPVDFGDVVVDPRTFGKGKEETADNAIFYVVIDILDDSILISPLVDLLKVYRVKPEWVDFMATAEFYGQGDLVDNQ